MFGLKVMLFAGAVYVALQLGWVGILLAAALTVVGANSARSWLNESERFRPLWVNVQPLANFYFANKLATEQQRLALDTGDETTESLNEAFKFTILRWNSGPSPLVYWHDRKCFSTTVSSRVEYKQLAFEKTGGFVRVDDPPQLYIDSTTKGFRLLVRRSGEHDLIPVATIPYAAFRCAQMPQGHVKSHTRLALLEEQGWTDDPNPSIYTNEIVHDQFRVAWSFV